MKRFRGMLFLLVIALLQSCAPALKVVKERTLSMDEVLRRVQERNDKIKTLKGSGTITVETPEESNGGSFELNLKKPDSLRLRFNGPFGIYVGTLMLSRDRFVFYNRMENKTIIGKPDGRTLQSIFRIKLQFDEVLRAFSGEFPTADRSDSAGRFSVQDGLYVVKHRTGDGYVEYRVDGDAFVTTSYRELDADEKSNLTAIASRVEETENISMPRLLRVIFPKERRSVTIAYDDVQINEPVECSFSPPKNAQTLYR